MRHPSTASRGKDVAGFVGKPAFITQGHKFYFWNETEMGQRAQNLNRDDAETARRLARELSQMV